MLRNVFQINVNDLKLMGGIVLIILAIRCIVFPKPFEKIQNSTLDIAAVPLAFPFLVAAVSFVTGMLIVKERGYVGGSLVFLSVFSLSWVILRFGSEILKLAGESVLSVFSKIMYIVLAAKAIKLLMSVLPQYFKN